MNKIFVINLNKNIFYFNIKQKNSETGNRTLVICVTGRDTDHYTISDIR